MEKALVLYMSVSGTTEKVAESISAGLRCGGWQVDLRRLDETAPVTFEDYGLLGIGYPTHHCRPPYPVTSYLRRLTHLDELPVFVFLTYGFEPGDAGNLVRRALRQKGGWELGYHKRRGAARFLGYLKEGYLFSPEAPSEEDLAWSKRFGKTVAARVAVGGAGYERLPEDPAPRAVDRVEGFLSNHVLTKAMYSRFFHLDFARCTSCGLCMEQCPAGNITADSEGKPIWGHDCLLCSNCERVCPENAISSPVDWSLFRPFYRYDVHRGRLDPDIPYRRVKLQRGRLEEA